MKAALPLYRAGRGASPGGAGADGRELPQLLLPWPALLLLGVPRLAADFALSVVRRAAGQARMPWVVLVPDHDECSLAKSLQADLQCLGTTAVWLAPPQLDLGAAARPQSFATAPWVIVWGNRGRLLQAELRICFTFPGGVSAPGVADLVADSAGPALAEAIDAVLRAR